MERVGYPLVTRAERAACRTGKAALREERAMQNVI